MADCEHKRAYYVSGQHRYCWECDHVFILEEGGKETQISDEYHNLDLPSKLDIFESRQEAWFFRPAEELLAKSFLSPKDPTTYGAGGELAAASIITGYFEAIQHFREGHPGEFSGASSSQVRRALARVLGLAVTADEVTRYCKEVRHGFFHAGMTYSKVQFDRVTTLGAPVWIDEGYLTINVPELLKAVRADFKTYVNGLRARTEDVTLFEVCWDEHWKGS